MSVVVRAAAPVPQSIFDGRTLNGWDGTAAITVTAISLVGYSAMSGVIGGGGLGDLAVRYGYQRFQTDVMVVTVLILIVLVQVLQWAGDKAVAHFTRK